MSDNIKILILEDEPITRALLQAILRKAGYQVTITSSYDEAFAAWQRGSFHLIIADFFLEGRQTGADFVREIRAAGKNVPAIALSIAEHSQNREDIDLAGFDCYLPKPIDVRVLSDTVAKLLASA
ncbi:response regulator [uncultured Thalassospira sp.]|jgi:CheY-like chemotaxis protein|uniref:response regulator n=1 Tax=uncultured Thalassospira sp. TaxID=404382 RepID=UPI0030DBA2F4|tara:strand:+ start:15023 stop:15397 length:375 start_codon:yes stop_codon:yes gene_type:complete